MTTTLTDFNSYSWWKLNKACSYASSRINQSDVDPIGHRIRCSTNKKIAGNFQTSTSYLNLILIRLELIKLFFQILKLHTGIINKIFRMLESNITSLKSNMALVAVLRRPG